MARISNNDEIPLAKRINPVGSAIYRKLRLFIFAGLFLSIVSTLTISNIFSGIKDSSDNGIQDQSNSDGRLLGHFPYDEAPSDVLVDVYPGVKVHRDIYFKFRQMQDEAYREGIRLILLSGYRSIDLQNKIFYENKSIRNQIALERAKVSAPPGHSEHSTGYAIDIGDGDMRETDFEVSFENTPAFRWMKKNAPRFHFILSFPKNNKQGVSYEPWHWRFEGTVEALRQFERANQMWGIK